MLIVLTLACTSGGFPDVVIGKADSADSTWGFDTSTEGEDSQRPDDSADDSDPPEDTSVPEPSGEEVCYLGADRKGVTCLPLVDYDPAWGDDYEYPDPLSGSAQYRAPIRFLDLNAVDAATKLAPNFVLSEVAQDWKGRYAVFQPHAVERLQDIRDAIGGPLTINSGYRNISYNASVGGAGSSRHVYGDAADMASSLADLEELGELCADLGAGYIGYYASHVHCDWRDDPLEPAFYGSAFAPAAAPKPEHRARLVPGPTWTAPAEGWDEGEPLREWRAYDAAGALIAEARGDTFTPPTLTAEVEVTVGRAVTLRQPAR